LVIASWLRGEQAGEGWSIERLRNWARQLFDRDLAYSMSHPDGLGVALPGHGPSVLREFYYRTPNAQQLYCDARRRLLQAVDVFVTNPVFACFREAARQPDALIEHRISVRDLPCKVEGRLDLAYPMHDGAMIIDWKLGDGGSAQDRLQLIAYALWACQHFDLGADQAHLYEAYLASGKIARFELTEAVLARGRNRILQDAERMATMDDYGRAAQAEAFSPHAQPAVCRLCPFQKVCSEGRKFLND
jgi:CRISPR/Cas system-associated exonuclease Cas4 (RecB family)